MAKNGCISLSSHTVLIRQYGTELKQRKTKHSLLCFALRFDKAKATQRQRKSRAKAGQKPRRSTAKAPQSNSYFESLIMHVRMLSSVVVSMYCTYLKVHIIILYA